MRALRWLVAGSVWLCIAFPRIVSAQTAGSDVASYNRFDLFGGYSFLSNSFNDSSAATSHVPLNGWDAGLAFRAWHKLGADSPWHQLGIKTDVSGYYGTSLGSPQRPVLLLVGPQYTWEFGKNRPFIEGQVGFGHLNGDWFYHGLPGAYSPANSFAAFLGAGFDHAIAPRMAFRVEGGMLRTNFTVPNPDGGIHGLPNYFARISTGLVWHF